MINIVVICADCGAICPSVWKDGKQIWLWKDRKCENCGGDNWAAHDPARDWKTGRLLNGGSSFKD